MVRETRHLWVGNLPENIREDRIREHFKRYGRVQSVKLLPRGEVCPVDGGSGGSLGEGNEGGSGSSSGSGVGNGGGNGGTGSSLNTGGASATVAFMDIKSAAKAHATEHTLDERALTTQYYEPQHLQHRFPSHGSSEDHGSSGVSGTGGVGGSGSGGVGVVGGSGSVGSSGNVVGSGSVVGVVIGVGSGSGVSGGGNAVGVSGGVGSGGGSSGSGSSSGGGGSGGGNSVSGSGGGIVVGGIGNEGGFVESRGSHGSSHGNSHGSSHGTSHGSFYGGGSSGGVVGVGVSGVGVSGVGSGVGSVGGVGSGSGGGGGGVGGSAGGGGSGGVVVVPGHPADPTGGDPGGGYIPRGRPPPGSSYHVTSSRARDRLYPRTGPYASGPPPPPHLDRHRAPSSWSSAYESATSSRYGNAPPPPSPATNDAYQDEPGGGGGGGGGGSGSSGVHRQHKKQRRKSRSGSSSPSGSSRSGSTSSSRSGSSAGSTSAGSTSPGSSPHRAGNAAVTEDRRPLAICVRNLPARSSDTSLKDGLFHEYKKHGKVTWVKVVGAAGDRYALVCFKKPEDVEKALEVSHDKLFFGCKIEVAPYQGYDVEDNEFRPYEAEVDEYHPKATRTLFIGNLEKDVTASELRKHFEPFGEIIEIDIKKQGSVTSYAFCQYSDIGSVVKAMRSMDGEHLGANRIKLGFGKSMPTSCVWVDGIGDCMSEKYLNMQFHQFGPITQVVVDRERGHALVFFEQISCAQAAVKEMRGAALRGRRLQVDFASRECQETFYEHLERQGVAGERPWDTRPSPATTFDVARERSSFESAVTVSNSSSRFTRYDTPPRSRTASYSRTSGGGSTPGASPAHPTAMSRSSRRSYQDSYYDGDYNEPAPRRFRSYDEFSQGSGASHDDYQSSVLSDGKLNDDDCPPPPSSRRHAVQSVVTSVEPPVPPPPLLPPPDIRHLQKERVHLLEQLEECHSSGDEVAFAPKKRAKLDGGSATILCEDDEPEIASLLVTSHSGRKGMEVRRVSDSKVVMHHSTRRSSCEGRGPGPCKRRRDASSRHHEHHDGSRPGTPLVDERPENLVPSEPRRFRERSHEGPLSLPLPRFATQMLNNNNNNNNNNTSSSNNNSSSSSSSSSSSNGGGGGGGNNGSGSNGGNARSSSGTNLKVSSPPCSGSGGGLSVAASPCAAPQAPASPPPRHLSPSPTSSDSETAPQSPSLEERIRSLDEKYEKWSGSRALSAAGGDALAKLDASASERFKFRHKLLDLDLHEVQPSDIVKSVLAKRSVFDEDSKRLENFSEKYEPKEFTGVIGVVGSMIGSTAGLTSSSGACTSKVCLQYPFPSHPPAQVTGTSSASGHIGGGSTMLSASMVPSILKTTDPRSTMQHNCVHPTPATPITPGTSIKTVSPELPPVSLPIGLASSGTAASSGNGSGLASANSLLSGNSSVCSIHSLSASTNRVLLSSNSLLSSSSTTSSSATSSSSLSTSSSTSSSLTSISTSSLASSSLLSTSSTLPSSISVSSSCSTISTGSTTVSSFSTATTASVTTTTAMILTTSTSTTSVPTICSSTSTNGNVAVTTVSSTSSSSSSSGTIQSLSSGQYQSSTTTASSSVPLSSTISTSSFSSSSLLLCSSSGDIARARLRKDIGGSSRERRDSREGRDSRESKHGKAKDCQRRSRKEEVEIERTRKDNNREDKESGSSYGNNDIGDTLDNHSRDFKESKESRYERREREDKERREKDDRERQERREKEDRDRQERKEREERERREKDEERRERERLDKERQEKDRREREDREREKKEREENERREKERLEREKREREEKERQERREREERERRDREERERKERELRLEREKQEKERLRKEREEQERREKEERERLERERRREEKERLEKERKREREEKERLERERRKEKEERERLEKEKREKEEKERLEREKHEREKRREREDQERRDKEKVEREKRRDREEKEKEKREREESRRQPTDNHLHQSVVQSTNQVSPAPVPIKRRCSSQDGPTEDDAKRMKISDHRRDSKDRPRQNRRSEDRKHRNDSHRSSRESRESRDSKESSGPAQESNRDGSHADVRESTRESRENNRESGKEKQRSKRSRSEKESRERSPRVCQEPDKEFLSRLELSKRNEASSPNDQISTASNHTREAPQFHQQQASLNQHSDVDDGPGHEMQVARHPSATDTDSDEPKKHSIFDIVDDEPAYISMYDKVKARSTKNMQKLEEEKRQVRLKDKFSQLKQSRARREEKKQSTSWDGDSVSSKALTEDEATSESDSARAKSLSRKGSRSRIHSDTSEEEESFNNKVRKNVKTERFLESDVDLGFADTEEKQNPLENTNVVINNVHGNAKEEVRTSDDDERGSVAFHTSHQTIVVNNHERDSRKKSHKKKQKRQKNSVSSEESSKLESTEITEHKNKSNVISTDSECRTNHTTDSGAINTPTATPVTAIESAEERMRADKKQRTKKDKRRERNGEDKVKARRKRLNRQEARDSQRMEDIFGPLSDDVDDAPSNTFFNRLSNMTSENNAYVSDSDGGRSPVLDVERVRRKTEKKRRHHQEDENSVDLAEAGREIEAKLLGLPNSPKSAVACTESNEHDVFRFTDDNDSVEPSTPTTVPEKVKEKKKKRKKSKEERSRKDYHHHHHHHHHHHEKTGELPYLGADPSPPRASSPLIPKTLSPTLPTLRDTLLSPIPKVVTSNTSTVTAITAPVVTGVIQPPKPEKKKDKFIPGFGIEIDEAIHENAVKSISEPEERESGCQSRSGRDETEVTVSTTPPVQNEDKPRVAISQEETEDAVAALLEETFGGSTEDFSYEGEEEDTEADGTTGPPAEAPQEDVEEMQQAVESLNASAVEGEDLKPDTPQSEHDLQIDTDTEEDPNYESFDLTQPPKTPDIPSFYKSPTKTPTTVTLAIVATEKPAEARLPPNPVIPKSQSSPNSVIAHSWNINEHKSRDAVKPVQIDTVEPVVTIASPEIVSQPHRTSTSSPPTYKQPMLASCNVPIANETSRISAASPRPSSISVQPVYQRLPVSPQSQMVPMRQASPRMQNVSAPSSSSPSSITPLPPLVPSRIPPLIPSQLSPRIPQPLSPNGQWSRNSTLSSHVSTVGKPSPPPTRIAVSVPISAHRPEVTVQQIYSTAATQQPVIQHAAGLRPLTPSYPRGGLPPLTLNIPPRPYMPVPPLAPGIQVKNSRDSTALGNKSVIETLLAVNPNEPPPRLEEPKLSPAVIPESTNKASTSPKVPSPNQPPTYIPETAKIEISASASSPAFGKSPTITENCPLQSRSQKQIPPSVTGDNNVLSPRPKQELSNLQLLTTHVPRCSTPSPVIIAHGQSHIVHKSVVHGLDPPPVSSPNQSLIKTVVPIVSQQLTPAVQSTTTSDKCIIPLTTTVTWSGFQDLSPVPQTTSISKSHLPVGPAVLQSIMTRVVMSTTVSSVSTPSITDNVRESTEPRITQTEQPAPDSEAQVSQTAQPMQLTPPIQSSQPIEIPKQEPTDIVKQEDAPLKEELKFTIPKTEVPLEQPCDTDIKLKEEKHEFVESEKLTPCVPKTEVLNIIVPKLENEATVKSEVVSEVKVEEEEEEVTKENEEVELDEEPVEDPLKEPSTDPLAIDVSKEDPTDSKEDSDYWSAKEVNIESVIKKVDALCDGEGNDGEEDVQHNQETHNNSLETAKSESDWFETETPEDENKKNATVNDEQDEGVETCETESIKSRRGKSKARRGSCRGGVTTRRGSRSTTAAATRRGGRTPRGNKHHVAHKLPYADVYEFHDDSEEDNPGRPRLILTIKSGPHTTVNELPLEELVSPATNTRKSRRLAEKDGSRNTIDDVIEDVVRGSANKNITSGNFGNIHTTRRSTRHNNASRNVQAPQPKAQVTEPRKSPRVSRKSTRRTSENNDDSGEEKFIKLVVAAPKKVDNKNENAAVEEPVVQKAEETNQTHTQPEQQKPVSLEPTTLIDPVTGMLIPMRESEEGQYIPVSTASSQQQTTTTKTISEPRTTTTVVSESLITEKVQQKASFDNPLPKKEEPKKELAAETPVPCPPVVQNQQISSQASVITKPQSPVIQAPSTITVVQPPTACTTVVTTMATIPSVTTSQPVPSTPVTQNKPTSLKAHVLNASKLSTQSQQQIVITKPVVPTLPSQAIVQNIVKQPTQAIQGLHLQIPGGRVVSPNLSPCTKQAQVSSGNVKQGQPMSPVLNNTGVPPNPKQHLLQAAKQQQQQQASAIVNMSQKLPINVHPASVVSAPAQRIHHPVSQAVTLKGINGQPHALNPKAHLLQAVVPTMVTGPVASPPTQPHLVGPQTVAAAVGCPRPTGPKPQVTGTMEPPKVEVSMSGCIMVPTASPQTRGVPIPTYDAPLHGSASTAPSAGAQYGLVAPHRSQSPPLPPPAHHHANTGSQSDVVNHYGGLSRAAELPPHYIHPQVFQYQYLRAQHEALTPRITAYHIPGTRSPHLPLDPKLETGIEDSHSPPLELRRSTRTPQDRTTDSPQVAQVYMLHGSARLPPPPPQYNAGSNPSLAAPTAARGGYYEPPPAHLRSQYPMPASEAPTDSAITPDRPRKHQVVTPPHASQVPPQADSFQMLLQRYPVMWQGLLALKNDQAAVQMHFVFGNPNVARESLPCNSDGSTPPLRIAQRMRLEQTQVDGVARKMQTDNEHCMLLALPCGRDEVDVLQQSKNLQTGFIMYLQQKQAAGIVNIAAPGSQQPAYVIHIFPSCDFANESLARIAPDLLHRVAKIAHLLIVIATV